VTAALVSGLFAGWGVAIPVGAIGVLIISLSARTSLRVGAGAALGVAAADGLYAAVAVIGGAAIATVVRPIATPLRIVAALVLIGMAVKIGWTAWRHHHDPTRPVKAPAVTTAPRAFAALLALTALNPATVIYFAALVLGMKSGAGHGVARSVTWVVAVLVASASWQLLLAVGGSALGRALSSERGRLVTAVVSAVLILGLAIRTLAA
jgi:arginine exporter protein ArgO